MNKAVLALLCGLGFALPAQAKRPSYSFFDAAYLKSEVDDSDGGANGVRLALSASLNRWFYFTAGHDRSEAERSDFVFKGTSAGFGVHSLGNGFQVFGAGTYERLDVDGTVGPFGIDAMDEGYGLAAGARMPVGLMEVQAEYKYTNFGEDQGGNRIDEDRYRLGALAHLTRTFALTGSYEWFEQAEDLKNWTLGVRVYFQNRDDLPRRKKRGPTPPPPPPEDSVEQDAEAQ